MRAEGSRSSSCIRGAVLDEEDAGAWTIPKGEIGEDEEPLAAARREMAEETGFAPEGNFIALPPVRQRRASSCGMGRRGRLRPGAASQQFLLMEWPPRSGRIGRVPEVDRGAWYGMTDAREKLLEAQLPLLDALEPLV
jgi:predicted NUDIX family NTP pyrophosphohydrolase